MSAASELAQTAKPGLAPSRASEIELAAASEAHPPLGEALREAGAAFQREAHGIAGAAADEQRAALGVGYAGGATKLRLCLAALAAGGGLAFHLARGQAPAEETWPWSVAMLAVAVLLVSPEALRARRAAPPSRSQTIVVEVVAGIAAIVAVILLVAGIQLGAALVGAVASLGVVAAIRCAVARAGDPAARERADGAPVALRRGIAERTDQARRDAEQRMALAQREVPRAAAAALGADRAASLRALVDTAALPEHEAERLVAAPLGTAHLDFLASVVVRGTGSAAVEPGAGR